MAGAELLMIGFFFIFGTSGAIFCFGGIRKWKCLVDPDEPEKDALFVNSHIRLKRILGTKWLRVFVIFTGALFFIIGICGIVMALTMPGDNWAF